MNMLSHIVIFMSLFPNKESFTFCHCYCVHVGKYIKVLYRFIVQNGLELIPSVTVIFMKTYFFSINFLFLVVEVNSYFKVKSRILFFYVMYT